MIDKNRIPEPVYDDLINFFGLEKAEEILNKENYLFKKIQNRILLEKLKRKYGKRYWLYILLASITIIALSILFS
jgi:hypothetical protein